MRWRDVGELSLLLLAFLLYFSVRGAVIDRPDLAYEHALQIIDAERRVGIFWEANLNAWASKHLVFAQTLNLVYFWLHFPLIIVFAIWLYFAHPNRYSLLRDAFLASGGIALVCYWLYPVAPPRELPILAAEFDPTAPPEILGFVDTMRDYLGYAYQTQSTRPFVNPYAAMPSLHFGWDLILGGGVIWVFGGPARRYAIVVGIALPLLQFIAVIASANHFILDVVAGAGVAGLGVSIALLARRLHPALAVRKRSWRADLTH